MNCRCTEFAGSWAGADHLVFNYALPEPVVIKKMTSPCPAHVDRGYEPLLKREGTFVYTKEGNRVPSLNTWVLCSMNKTDGRRKMFMRIQQVDWAAAQHLLNPF
jgi:hypothetical protein